MGEDAASRPGLAGKRVGGIEFYGRRLVVTLMGVKFGQAQESV